MNATKTATFWLVIVVSSFLLWQVVRSQSAQTIPEISYSDFLARVVSGKVSKVTIAGSVVQGSDANGGSFRVIAPSNQSVMVESLQQHGVEIRFKETAEQGWPSVLLNLVPVFVIAVVWFYLIRQKRKSRSTGEGPSSSLPPQESKTRFGP
jgi:cell division protease FtsH